MVQSVVPGRPFSACTHPTVLPLGPPGTAPPGTPAAPAFPPPGVTRWPVRPRGELAGVAPGPPAAGPAAPYRPPVHDLGPRWPRAREPNSPCQTHARTASHEAPLT